MWRCLILCILLGSIAARAELVGKNIQYTTKEEDTFADLGEKFDVGFVALRAANPHLDPWAPGPDQTITIPGQALVPEGRHNGILINLAEMRLYYFKPGAAEPEIMAIGVGREGLDTPRGSTTILRKAVGPTWYPTPRMLQEDPALPTAIPAGPDNPLGTHAMYLGWYSYLIHGTNKAWGVGRRTSSGCIRLYPAQIKELFGMVPIGTAVTVVYQPVKLGWEGNDLWLEAHPERAQADQIEMDFPLQTEIPNGVLSRIQTLAGDAEIDWAAVDLQLRERTGLPVIIAHRDISPVQAPIIQAAPADKEMIEKAVISSPIEVKTPASAQAKAIPATHLVNEEEVAESIIQQELLPAVNHAPSHSLAATPSPDSASESGNSAANQDAIAN